MSSTVIIGAGPAGLTAAYLLTKHGYPVSVLEADSKYVGGISRTVEHNGYRFDIGGHRFFSKAREVEELWTELLPDDFLTRPRSSRIYYQGKFFRYPLKADEALRKLGLLESARCVLSFTRAKAFPVRQPRNLEEWVTNQFGHRLFSIFFKTYTEKVWGLDCREISADWAAQRIKGLSLGTAVLNALMGSSSARDGRKTIKTLIDSFRYPRLGPGMLWEQTAAKVVAQGGAVHMGCRVTGLVHDASTKAWTVEYRDTEGALRSITAPNVISSAPLRELVNGIRPRPQSAARADLLRYRDFLTVALMCRHKARFDDQWLYVHDPTVHVGRVQNYWAWSPDMVPDPATRSYGLEYFCFEGDGLWETPDAELIRLAAKELQYLGLAQSTEIFDGVVARQPKAYPIYDEHYEDHVTAIRDELASRYPGLHLVGRNGMHKYNNQDHSMMTAMLTVQNIIGGQNVYDVWRVNQDAEYQESETASSSASMSGLRAVPRRVK